MSVIEASEEIVETPVSAGGSLRDRLAARREQLSVERTFVLPVPGYEDMFAARYKMLSYETLRTIGHRYQKLEGTAEGELVAAAATLINACVELLEKREDGSFVSLQQRWSTSAIGDLFGLDLPEGITVVEAMRLVIPSSQLIMHLREYDEELTRKLSGLDNEMAGESEPSDEG